MNITYRKAVSEDLEQVIKLIQPMWLLHGEKESKFLKKEYLKNYDINKYLENIFKTPKKHTLFVAEDNKKLVGVIHAEITKVDKMFTTQKILYIDDLAVDEKYRGGGIACLLMKICEDLAKAQGIKMLKVKVYAFNNPAQKLVTKEKYHNLYSEYYKIISASDCKHNIKTNKYDNIR